MVRLHWYRAVRFGTKQIADRIRKSGVCGGTTDRVSTSLGHLPNESTSDGMTLCLRRACAAVYSTGLYIIQHSTTVQCTTVLYCTTLCRTVGTVQDNTHLFSRVAYRRRELLLCRYFWAAARPGKVVAAVTHVQHGTALHSTYGSYSRRLTATATRLRKHSALAARRARRRRFLHGCMAGRPDTRTAKRLHGVMRGRVGPVLLCCATHRTGCPHPPS